MHSRSYIVTFVLVLLLAVPLSARAEVSASPYRVTIPIAEANVGTTQCPLSYWQRTPTQMWNDHWAALQAGNLNLAICDYAPDAQVVMPGSVLTGRDQILTGLSGFYNLFGGVPTFGSLTISREIIFFTWTFLAPGISVPDGADTYVVLAGHIYDQTVHATFASASSSH